MAQPVVSGNVADPGTILFVGDYVNKDTPLWLSMFGPKPGPGNVQVSSLTVSSQGFAELGASTITGAARNQYAQIIFDRAPSDTLNDPTELVMNTSHLVQGITPDQTFLTVSRTNGLFYDDLAVNAVQLFGNQSTDPTVNNGCAGLLYGSPAILAQGNIEAVPASVTLATPSFNTSTINSQQLTVSQIANISTINAVNLNVSGNVNISSLTTSSITTNAISANTFISTTTAVATNLNAITANISTANISTANISTANISTANISIDNISTANISTANVKYGNFSSLSTVVANISSLNAKTAAVQGVLTTGGLYLSTTNASAEFGLVSQFQGVPNRGVTMVAAPADGGIDMFVGSPNVNTLQTLGLRIVPSGTVSIPHDLNVSTISTGVLTTSILNAPLINVSTMFTNTLNFNPTISPEVDLGLGGIVGGLVGGASANVFNTALGVAALGTGIAGLTMPRTSGGLNPTQFQTYAGTAQMQFSTLGSATPSGFLTTTGGVGQYGATVSSFSNIPSGSWAFRTVSDPLNLATSTLTIGATSTIQAAGQWKSVFPGAVQMNSGNNITSLDSQNNIDLGGASGASFTINANYPNPSGSLPASDVNIRLNPISQVVIGGGNSLSVAAITGVSSINAVAYPPVDNTIPIGSMILWPVGNYANITPTAPPGYLLCDGSSQSSLDYPVLASILQNYWNPLYPAPNPVTRFFLPNTQGRVPIGGIVNNYRIYATYVSSNTITLPSGATIQGATFTNIQLADAQGSGGAGVLYRGMYATNFVTGNILNIFQGTGGWGGSVTLQFSMAFSPPSGTGPFVYLFTNNQSNPGDNAREYPVVGWTNPSAAGQTAEGYGAPYRYQLTGEVAAHSHPNGKAGGAINAANTSNNPIQGSDTGTNNGIYQVDGTPVPAAYQQNPPNFGVNYIIKAL